MICLVILLGRLLLLVLAAVIRLSNRRLLRVNSIVLIMTRQIRGLRGGSSLRCSVLW